MSYLCSYTNSIVYNLSSRSSSIIDKQIINNIFFLSLNGFRTTTSYWDIDAVLDISVQQSIQEPWNVGCCDILTLELHRRDVRIEIKQRKNINARRNPRRNRSVVTVVVNSIVFLLLLCESVACVLVVKSLNRHRVYSCVVRRKSRNVLPGKSDLMWFFAIEWSNVLFLFCNRFSWTKLSRRTVWPLSSRLCYRPEYWTAREPRQSPFNPYGSRGTWKDLKRPSFDRQPCPILTIILWRRLRLTYQTSMNTNILSSLTTVVYKSCDCLSRLLSAYSGSSKHFCVVREIDSGKESKQYLEVWTDSALVKNYDLSALDVHGKIYADGLLCIQIYCTRIILI